MTTRTDRSLGTASLLIASTLLASSSRGQEPAPAAAPAPAPAPAASTTPGWRFIADWAKLPPGQDIGSTHGCLCVDKQGRIFANTETERAVLVFAADGTLVTSWGKEYRGGLHGMCLRDEGGTEYLYLAHTGRHEVLKTTLAGEVLWTIGWPEMAGIYANEGEYKPTAIAVASDGRIFVGDGYGKSWVHVYDKDRRYVKSFGGPGDADGKFHTPHGLWLDARSGKELLLVCDRENHRLQWFTLDGEFVRKTGDGLRRPCNVWPMAGGGLAVADLTGRVALLDKDDKPQAFLGDDADQALRATNQVPREKWRAGTFFAPHSVCADGKGDLYVMDWNVTGRISKLERLADAAKTGAEPRK
jgi:outer membrane protein assembly factor BamB